MQPINTIEVNGESLAYARDGKGPPLVLMHSLGTGAWLWSEQMERWKDKFDVIAFDARGHGASSNKGGVTMENIAIDFAAALDAMGVGPAHFLGISMGGLIAAHLHAMGPGRIESLVIADSFASLGEAGPARVKALEDRITPISMTEWGQAYANETLLPGTPKEVFDRLASGIAAMDKESYLETVRSIFVADVSDEYAAIAAPVLVVCGEKDERTPPAAAEKIAGLIDGAELKLIPNAAHLANLDNPDGFHAAVDPFLEAQA